MAFAKFSKCMVAVVLVSLLAGLYYGLAEMGLESDGSLDAPTPSPVQGPVPERPDRPYCRAKVCNLAKPFAPRLYTMDHTDGVGHRVLNIVQLAAAARLNDLNVGGVLSEGIQITEHGCNFSEIVSSVVGESSNVVFRTNHTWGTAKASFETTFETLEDLVAGRKNITTSEVWLSSTFPWDCYGKKNNDLVFPVEFRLMLRQPLVGRRLVFASDRPAVAVHLRRGDLERDHTRVTALPDSYFLDHVKRIRRVLPNADVHLWTSTKRVSGVPFERLFWRDSDFDIFRENGLTVHVDDADIIEIWAHMARAQILITSPSSFSYVAATLNTRCVIYPPFVDWPLPGWVNGKDISDSNEEEVIRCIKGGVERESWWLPT